MKHFLNYLLIPLLILNFISFDFLNNDLKSNVDKFNINYQNQATENYSEYSENSISSQQFIDDLESVPRYGTYELQANVDFSDSENDDVTGIELNDIAINGNGYTLYNRDITEIFNTDTFEVSEEHNGLGYYSFFTKISECDFYNLNFDNFMLPFGIVSSTTFANCNFYDLYYENLIFNVESANIKDDLPNGSGPDFEINVATIGLIFQEINVVNRNSYLYNCCFENINFSNNTIILFDNSISTVIAPIGGIQIFVGFPYSPWIYFNNIYINNITFSNNEFISGINDNDLYFEEEQQEKYFSIFYSSFVGSSTNNFEPERQYEYTISCEQIIFNNVNIYNNNNNFANYTFYALMSPINTGITFTGKNIYGFNLNLDIQSQLDNNEKVAVGDTLFEDTFYPSEDFYYTGIYQTDWIDDVSYKNMALDYTSFSDSESMLEQIYSDNGEWHYTNWWYYDRLDVNQDYSFVLPDKPKIIHKDYDFYGESSDDLLDIDFILVDGRLYEQGSDIEKCYSNYTVNLINRDNDEIVWSGYAEYAPYFFEILLNDDYYNLLFENNLYFEISNDYHTWEQDVNLKKYFPQVYNVSSIVENNNLTVSYDFIDPYNLINSINISLYDNLNNEMESKIIDYNNLQNNYYLNSEQIVFETKIDDPNNYYLKFEVNCNIYRYGPQNIVIAPLRDDLIQYDQNSDIEFRTQPILPNDNKSIAIWLIILIVIIALVLILIFIFLIYYFMIKNKKLKI